MNELGHVMFLVGVFRHVMYVYGRVVDMTMCWSHVLAMLWWNAMLLRWVFRGVCVCV